MKIAITADIHLKQNKDEAPERYNALVNIIKKVKDEKINKLIIAGDLFDKEAKNYTIFNELVKINNDITFYVIPGNHDVGLNQRYFTAQNLQIINSPKLLSFNDNAIKIFLIPYTAGKFMGEILAQNKQRLSEPWVLVGHGDYISGQIKSNPYEPGTYMPLNGNDIEIYNPVKVILGHIHKRGNIGKVHYVGSPCGLDISETGRRYFSILDTENGDITPNEILTDILYYNEKLIMLPVKDEFGFIEQQIQKTINGWSLSDDELTKVRLRMKINGYTSDLNKLQDIVNEALKKIKFYNDEEPDLTEVNVLKDNERIQIIELVKEAIEKNDKELGLLQLTQNDVMEQSLHIILNKA